jgi:hypothetical protein
MTRGELWSMVRDATQLGSHAGERYGTNPGYGYERLSARLDAVAREYAGKIEAALKAAGVELPGNMV